MGKEKLIFIDLHWNAVNLCVASMYSFAHTHTCTHIHTHTLTHIPTLTHSLMHTHTHTHITPTYTHTQLPDDADNYLPNSNETEQPVEAIGLRHRGISPKEPSPEAIHAAGEDDKQETQI